MGRREGENEYADGDRHPESKRQRTSITTQTTGTSLTRSNTAASIAPADGEHERDREHRHVRPSGKTLGESEAANHRSPCHRRWRPWPVAMRFREAVHSDQLDASSEGGAQDRVLDQPRPGRPGDRTDNDQ